MLLLGESGMTYRWRRFQNYSGFHLHRHVNASNDLLPIICTCTNILHHSWLIIFHLINGLFTFYVYCLPQFSCSPWTAGFYLSLLLGLILCAWFTHTLSLSCLPVLCPQRFNEVCSRRQLDWGFDLVNFVHHSVFYGIGYCWKSMIQPYHSTLWFNAFHTFIDLLSLVSTASLSPYHKHTIVPYVHAEWHGPDMDIPS